jgi:hypothetical protein
MTNEVQNSPFLLLNTDGDGMYYVFLVNPTNKKYENVKKLTGAFTSIDNDLLETSKAVFILPELQPNSYIQIDDIDWRERDFTIWYQLDLISEDGTKMYLKGSVPKYLDKEEKELIAYGVNKEGWALDLIKRANDDSIDEIIKTMNMESRYITYEDSN